MSDFRQELDQGLILKYPSVVIQATIISSISVPIGTHADTSLVGNHRTKQYPPSLSSSRDSNRDEALDPSTSNRMYDCFHTDYTV